MNNNFTQSEISQTPYAIGGGRRYFMTDEERELIAEFRRLSPEEQKRKLRYIKNAVRAREVQKAS